MADLLYIKPVRFVRKKIPTEKKRVMCIEYEVVDTNGEMHTYSYISLDLKWIKPSINAESNTWTHIWRNPVSEKFRFDDDSSTGVHEMVVDMVANVMLEIVLIGGINKVKPGRIYE